MRHLSINRLLTTNRCVYYCTNHSDCLLYTSVDNVVVAIILIAAVTSLVLLFTGQVVL